nr:DUF4430 domain-containing protein [Brevibacillus fulvus]
MVCVFLLAAAVGLYQYREAQTNERPLPQGQTSVTPQPDKQPEQPIAHLWITRDFGASTLLDEQVPIGQAETVSDLLQDTVDEVETSYNGSFVQSIMGIGSTGSGEQKQDWFYYVNGKAAEVAATEYTVKAGDVVWWDYHSWKYAINTPAQIGAYPHPFVDAAAEAAQTAVVMASPGYEALARQTAAWLTAHKAGQVKQIAWNDEELQAAHPLILVGDSKALANSAFLRSLWEQKQQLGLFAELTADGIRTFDQYGKPRKVWTSGGTGTLLATIHPATRQPLWIVSGTDRQGVENAAALLRTDEAEQWPLQPYFSVVLNQQQKIQLPIVDKEVQQ